jgi:NAD-specific glutamate dehydrogenase
MGIVRQAVALGAVEQATVIAPLAVQYYKLKAFLGLEGFIKALAAIPISNTWQAQVRDNYLLEIEQCISALAMGGLHQELELWFAPASDVLERWRAVVEDINNQGLKDFAVFAVAMGLLAEIAQRV